ERKQRRLQQIDHQVLLIADLRQRVSRCKYGRLHEPVRELQRVWRLLADVFHTMDAESLLVPVVPLSRRSFSFVRSLAVLTDHLCFDDVEYLFRVDVTAGLALSPVSVNLECRF